MTTATETTTHRLTGRDEDWASIGTSVKALLFGKLLDLASSTVEHYRSDFFHDACWIEKHVHGPTVFFFGFRQWGTSIGTDRQAVAYGNDVAYSIVLTSDRGDWYATIEPLELVGATGSQARWDGMA